MSKRGCVNDIPVFVFYKMLYVRISSPHPAYIVSLHYWNGNACTCNNSQMRLCHLFIISLAVLGAFSLFNISSITLGAASNYWLSISRSFNYKTFFLYQFSSASFFKRLDKEMDKAVAPVKKVFGGIRNGIQHQDAPVSN